MKFFLFISVALYFPISLSYGCVNSKQGCYKDGVTEAQTEEPSKNLQASCTLERDKGPCKNYSVKWFFDTGYGGCSRFWYGGCDGNSNLFNSKEECNDVCVEPQGRSRCLLSKISGPCNAYYPRWYFDNELKTCTQFIYGGCLGNNNRFENREECMETCEKNNSTGLVLPSKLDEKKVELEIKVDEEDDNTPLNCAVIQGNPEPSITWKKGDLLIDGTEPVYTVLLDGAVQIVTVHKTNSGIYLCTTGTEITQPVEKFNKPNLTDPCTLPMDTGPCTGEYEQWFYNHTTDSCHIFTYGGCLGNNNRFDNMETCEQHCKQYPSLNVLASKTPPPEPIRSMDSLVCHVGPEPGNCTESFPSYYYDVKIQKCSAFIYTGCGGNANRYTSIEQCERQCGEFRDQDVCNLQRNHGPCRKNLVKYYYDSTYGRCAPFYYGGCDGNGNRFSSQEECEYVCIIHEEKKPSNLSQGTVNEICRLPLDGGPCKWSYHKRYYHDSFSGECIPFIYSGCGGNFNNFKSLNDCLEFCKECQVHDCDSMNCEYGTETYQDQETKCTRCRCYTPCHNTVCDEGFECVVDVNLNPTIDDNSTFIAVCRPVYKEGECPEISPSSDNIWEIECKKDADCSTNLKCCSTGYRTVCIVPDFLQVPAQLSIIPSLSLHTEQSEPKSSDLRAASIVRDEENSHVLATLGAPIILPCYAIGNPIPSVTWWNDDMMIPIRSSQFETRKDYSLLIRSVQLNTLGIYTCQAYNGIGKSVSWSVTVEALGPVYSTRPEDRKYIGYIINPAGNSTSTTESIYEAENQSEVVPTYSAKPDSNEIQPESSTEQETVSYKAPVKVTTQLQTRFKAGSDIYIDCNVEGYPNPLVQWYKDGQPLYPSDFIEISENHRLHIKNVSQLDTGDYRCEAANDYSRSANSINIIVEGVKGIHPKCTDNNFFANCALIVRGQYCKSKYYARFCCRSCTEAGQLPSYGPHLGFADD